MDAKISVFVICVEAIIYLLLYNLHDVPLNSRNTYMENTFNTRQNQHNSRNSQ